MPVVNRGGKVGQEEKKGLASSIVVSLVFCPGVIFKEKDKEKEGQEEEKGLASSIVVSCFFKAQEKEESDKKKRKASNLLSPSLS